MMLLTDKKGVVLVLLVIVITITGVIGAGIISLMGAKQKSYPFQVQSYQAYMLAHAGVEFAIRYAHDNKDGFTSSANTYIPSYNTSNPSRCIDPVLNSGQWKQIQLPSDFLNGNFSLYISLEGNCASPPCILHACGKYGTSIREITLSNFQRYY
jgi:Tfp pilus assembly protein PilV